MGCIPHHKSKIRKSQTPIMVYSNNSSITNKECEEDILSSSEKIIILKPLPYSKSSSKQTLNTYIHNDSNNSTLMKSYNNYIHGHTLTMEDDDDGVGGVNISKIIQDKQIYHTHLIKHTSIAC